MARVAPVINKFNGGQVSPLLDARIDLELYANSCLKMLNFIGLPQGPAERRRGTRYIANTKTNANVSRLIPFIFSEIQSYALEFGNQYIRFYQDQGQIQYMGSPYEISSPYLTADLPLLKFAQNADVMYITHPDYAPRKLSRLGATNWTLTAMNFLYGPNLEENTTAINIRTNGISGSVTITASAALFASTDVGGVWKLSEASGSLSPYGEWTPAEVVGAADYRRIEGRLYYTAAGGTTGTITPIHESGTVNDGGIDWTFINFGSGFVKITAYTSSTVVTGTVQRTLPPTIVTGSPLFAATTFWNDSAWSAKNGYPAAVVFFEQRLFFAGTDTSPQTIWGSKSNGQYENFDPEDASADSALDFTPASNDRDTIRWLASKGNLIAGTYSGAFLIRGSGNDDALTPSNIQAKKNTGTACSTVSPVLIGEKVYFSQRAGKKVFTSGYSADTDGLVSSNITIKAQGIADGGILEMAYQQEPYNILWMTSGDGQLLGITVEDEQQVAGWHRHDTDGSFESLCCVPNGTNDELWVIVKRTIGGATKRYVELLEPDDSISFYVDSGLIYDGAAATVISGLDHLEGETVAILADGAVVDSQVVVSGDITLSVAAELVYAGLPYNSDLIPMKIEAGGENGPALGKLKRVHELLIRLYKTLGLKVGPDADNLKSIPFRTTNMPMDNAPTLFATEFAEDKTVAFNDTWQDGLMFIRQDQPLPATIVCVAPRMVTNDK
jgi:hypothetical protein